MKLEGTFTALITPFTADGARVDLDALTRNVNHQSIAGVGGVVPCGTTGETPTLTPDEYRTVVEHVVETARPLGLTVIAGAGSNATAHAIAQHRFCARAGAHGALHVTPYYNRPTQEGLYRHFMGIAESADLPIVLYHIPGRTGVRFELATIVRLAQHPNIVAVKEASNDPSFAAQILEETDLVVLSGDDPLTLPLATIGARGVVSVLSNLLPDRVAAMCSAFLRGDWDTARTMNTRLLPIARGLLSLDSNPVPLKAALHLAGRDTGAVRPPLYAITDDRLRELERLMDSIDASLSASAER